MKLLFISVAVAFFLVGCQNNSSNTATANKSAASPVNVQANQASNQPSAIKTAQGTGIVTKINLEIGSVELDHDEIKGMMPAMLMEFYVAEKKELESLKVGDKVLFTLEDNRGAEKITKIAKVE